MVKARIFFQSYTRNNFLANIAKLAPNLLIWCFLMKYHQFGYFLATKGQMGYVSLINFQFGQLVTDMLIFGKKIIRSVGLKKKYGVLPLVVKLRIFFQSYTPDQKILRNPKQHGLVSDHILNFGLCNNQ